MSYALDVHDEIRDAIYRRTETPAFDRSLLAAAFVTLTELEFDEGLISLCIEPSSPIDFKVSFFLGLAHLAVQENSAHYLTLFTRIVPFIRAQLKNVLLGQMGPQSNGYYAMRKQSGDQAQTELLYSILRYLNARPLAMFDAAPPLGSPEYSEFYEDTFASFTACLASDDELVRSLTSNVARKLLADNTLFLLRRNIASGSDGFSLRFWKTTLVFIPKI
jgi:hypothetical protein